MFFFNTYNTYEACLPDTTGLGINANHITSENFFGHHPVTYNGVTVGYYDIKDVSENGNTLFDVKILEKFKIPKDSFINVDIHNANLCKVTGSLKITPGSSTEMLKDGKSFITGCRDSYRSNF